MKYTSTKDTTFLTTVAGWIAESGEILVLIRHSHKAGAKDFEFFLSADAFRDRIRQLSPRDCVTVFGRQQLPLRGCVDDDFIGRAVTLVPDGAEFVIVSLEPVQYGHLSWFPKSAGDRHAELRESLAEMRGRLVAVGLYPPWLEDSEDVISAVSPNPDGSVATGAY